MSQSFALAGYSVVASDSLTFPILHARSRILLKEEPDFSQVGGYAAILQELNNATPTQGYFWREFSPEGQPANGTKPRGYFTPENAAAIDSIRTRIRDLRQRSMISELEHSLLLHDLVLAVNDVANIAGTYGYYRSSWSASALERISLQQSRFIHTSGQHEVLQGNVEEIAPNLNVDAVYLDPPYTKRQYGGNYHVLETIAQEDEPVAVGEGGLRDWYPQYSDFCSKRNAESAFRKVLERIPSPHIFISYSEDGLLGTEVLKALLGEYGVVTQYDYPLSRYRSNNGGKGGRLNEHLFHIEVAR